MVAPASGPSRCKEAAAALTEGRVDGGRWCWRRRRVGAARGCGADMAPGPPPRKSLRCGEEEAAGPPGPPPPHAQRGLGLATGAGGPAGLEGLVAAPGSQLPCDPSAQQGLASCRSCPHRFSLIPMASPRPLVSAPKG